MAETAQNAYKIPKEKEVLKSGGLIHIIKEKPKSYKGYEQIFST
jgi:hypothetical protein